MTIEPLALGNMNVELSVDRIPTHDEELQVAEQNI
jgi:hypothetical protein